MIAPSFAEMRSRLTAGASAVYSDRGVPGASTSARLPARRAAAAAAVIAA